MRTSSLNDYEREEDDDASAWKEVNDTVHHTHR